MAIVYIEQYRFIAYIGVLLAIALFLYTILYAGRKNNTDRQSNILNLVFIASIIAICAGLGWLILMLCGVVDKDYTMLYSCIPWIFILLGVISAKRYRQKNNHA